MNSTYPRTAAVNRGQSGSDEDPLGSPAVMKFVQYVCIAFEMS